MLRHAVIVDPYTAAAEYADKFRERDITPVAVYSTAEPVESFHWTPEQGRAFEGGHFFDGGFDRLVSQVARYEPVCIIAGNETAVELTDALCAQLLPDEANRPETAGARRDKWLQGLAVERAGLPVVRQACSDDPDVIAEWIAANGLGDTPLVFKPTKGGGTDSVYLIRPGEDWRPVFDTIFGVVNRMGVLNDVVLAMEFAEGPEFMVDTNTVDGVHGLTMVSVYGKHNVESHLGVYDFGETLARDDPRTSVLFDFTKRVADALGVRNAAGHTEVILTPDGPRLVEMGVRHSGSCMQIHQRASTGDCQIDRSVRHYAGEDIPFDYRMERPTRTVWLAAGQAGRLVDAGPLDAIAALPSAHATKLPQAGQWFPRTVNVFTAIGWVVLAAGDAERIEADYARLRELEAQLSFADEPSAAVAR